jgi:Ca2+-binding EF-hand superfamily protein
LTCSRGQVIFYWTLLARLLSRNFDANPHLRPAVTPLPDSVKPVSLQILLSPAQQDQIRQIFELFDTDGGGSIDRSELEFAMTALGFHSQNHHAAILLDSIAGDGRVTLTEFSSLMTGEVLGSNQFEGVQAVFAALSKPDGESRHNNLITLRKLEDACLKYEVCANLQLLLFCFAKMPQFFFVF